MSTERPRLSGDYGRYEEESISEQDVETHPSIRLITQLQLLPRVQSVIDMDAGVQGLEVDLDRFVVEDVICEKKVRGKVRKKRGKRRDAHSCRSLTPNSTGPLILLNAILGSFLLLAFHLLPLISIASNAPFPTALLASLASYIHAFSALDTSSLMCALESGILLNIKLANG
jgi:hypothetical protein